MQCDECQLYFRNDRNLAEHKEIHNSDTIFTCEICKHIFPTAIRYVLHKYHHTGEYQCTYCDFKGTQGSIRYHIARHEDNFKYRCKICQKGFSDLARLKDHLEIHEAVPKYECHICPKKFTVSSYLKIHIRLNHKKEVLGFDESYECTVCAKKFAFKRSLERHLIAIHSIGNGVRCPVCEKACVNNYDLNQHIKSHTGERDFYCEVCGRGFINKACLRRHQLKTKHNKE